MGRDKKNPALIELIIVIFFFSLSAAIIVQLFMTSYQISRKSQGESIAIIMAQDVIEQLKTEPFNAEKILKNWESTKNQDKSSFTAYFDGQMNLTVKEQSKYVLSVQIENVKKDNGILVEIHISANENKADSQLLFNIDASQYVPSLTEDIL